MKPRHLPVLLLLIIQSSLALRAQSKVDSLLARLKTTPTGQAKIDLYEKIGWYYIDIQDLVHAKIFADSIHFLSEKLQYKKGHFQALYSYGIISHNQGNYFQAQQQLQAVVDYSQAQGDSSLLGKGLYHLAVVNNNLGNYDRSLATFYRLLSIEEKRNDPRKIGTLLNAIGGVHIKTGKFPEAVEVYTRAAAIFKTAKMPLDYGMTLSNMANVYIEQKNYDLAKRAYQEALRIYNEAKHPVFIAVVLGNIGNLHEARNEYEQALGYHQQALAIWRKDTKKRSLANCLNNLGKTSLKLKQYAEADAYLKEALQIGLEIRSNSLLQETYSAIHALQVERNDFKQAYHFYSLANQIKDSLFSETNTKQINELQARYETEKKDKQIALLAKEKAIQAQETQRQASLKKAFIGGGILISLLAGLLVYIFRQKLVTQQLITAKDTEIKEVNFKRQMSELEMKALRAQINPHFLFNCMNSIHCMILEGENENAALYLSKFSKLVRMILENAENATVTLQSELTLLESYIQLEGLRFKGRIEYFITVDESINPDDTYLPAMVLQPFVENAIWHGLLHKTSTDQAGVISIKIKEENDRLYCVIEDNGIGREKAIALREQSLLKTKSLGMKITEERLRLLSKEQEMPLIRITDLKDAFNGALGTRVEINIPVS
jgi:tetratricopeptide (TPR) repeat protein